MLIRIYIWHPNLQLHETTLEKITTVSHNHYTKAIHLYNIDSLGKAFYFHFVKTPSLVRHSMEHNKQMIQIKKRWVEQYLFMLERGRVHYCPLNNSLVMCFRWLMDTNKITPFSKENPKNLKEADETSLNIMKRPLLHIHRFFLLEWTYFFSTYYYKKCYVGVNRCNNLPVWK